MGAALQRIRQFFDSLPAGMVAVPADEAFEDEDLAALLAQSLDDAAAMTRRIATETRSARPSMAHIERQARDLSQRLAVAGLLWDTFAGRRA